MSTIAINNDAPTAPTIPTKNFWEGTGFWVAILMFVGPLFTAWTTQTGDVLATFISGIPAVIFAARKLIKGGINFGKWLEDKNTWLYLSTLITMVFGAGWAELVPGLQSLVEAIGAGNVQSIIASVLSLISMIWFFVRDKALAQIQSLLA